MWALSYGGCLGCRRVVGFFRFAFIVFVFENRGGSFLFFRVRFFVSISVRS